MARSNGPFGPAGARPPARRHPADDPYAAPPAPQPNGHWPGPGYPDPAHAQQGQGYHFPPEPDANYGYSQQPVAPAPAPPFDRYQNGAPHQPYPAQQWGQPQPDPQGYDLGSYMPSGAQQYPPMDPAQFQHGADHGHYPPAQQTQQGYAENDAEYDEEFAEEDEPRRGRRWIFIAAALIGAIGVGGALAYTYKSFIAPPSGRVPLVKADPNVKAKAGRDTDKKMLGRLGDDAAPPQNTDTEAADDRTGDEGGGPRRVKTIPITPGGPQPAAQPPPSVPGIMLENMGPRPQPKAQPPPRVTIGQPPPSMPPPAQVDEPAPPPVKRAPVVVPPVAVKSPPVVRPPPPPAPPAAANTGAGFVAVVSSAKTRMDALKLYADLQQKYGEVLSGKTPDVQEADLSARGLGTMYRLVIGPPGSRDAANNVCNQLKTAGHKDCWVNSY